MRRTEIVRALAALGLAVLLAVLFFSLGVRPVRVVGPSMEPTLTSGRLVWVWVTPGVSSLVEPGDVVVARVEGKIVVKRVKNSHNERLILRGDNQTHSLDSSRYGPVPLRQVLGKVIWPRVSSRPAATATPPAGNPPGRS